MSDFRCRLATAKDIGFVVKTWLDSYRASHSAGLLSLSPHVESCEACAGPVDYGYAAVMRRIVQRILARPGVSVWVAANPRALPPNDLHGWLVAEKEANVPVYRPPRYQLEVQVSPDPLVHYVYVKKIYRELGLARALFQAAGVDPRKRFLYTCHTSLSVAVEKAGKVPRSEWAPMSARFTKETGKIHDQASDSAPFQPSGALATKG